MTKKTKAPEPPKPKNNTFTVERKAGESNDACMARLATDPTLTSAKTVTGFSSFLLGDVDLTETRRALVEQTKAVHSGDLCGAESMLTAQALALNSMFTALALRAQSLIGCNKLHAMDAYMKLALRAQNQARMTLETLATIKNPPVVFAKQANIANNQQVNNGEALPVSRAGETGSRPNELSRIGHDKRQSLDGGTLQGPIGSRPSLETLGAIERAKDRKR